MATKIQLKRGLNANFGAVILSEGEPAFVTDTGKLYVGSENGKTLINPIDKPEGLITSNSYTKVKINEYGQVVLAESLSASDIPNISSSQITGLGTAATVDIGTQSGNVPVLDATGKLSNVVLPPLAITDTFIVGSQIEMLALDAQVGDIAVRTDIRKTFILKTAPANIEANWIELATPTDAVLSINGKTGTVVLSSSDIAMTEFVIPGTYTPITPADSTSLAIGKLVKNFDSFALLDSPSFMGTPTVPTALTSDNSTKIANTEYVQTALATIDGGTF